MAPACQLASPVSYTGSVWAILRHHEGFSLSQIQIDARAERWCKPCSPHNTEWLTFVIALAMLPALVVCSLQHKILALRTQYNTWRPIVSSYVMRNHSVAPATMFSDKALSETGALLETLREPSQKISHTEYKLYPIRKYSPQGKYSHPWPRVVITWGVIHPLMKSPRSPPRFPVAIHFMHPSSICSECHCLSLPVVTSLRHAHLTSRSRRRRRRSCCLFPLPCTPSQ